MIPIIGTANIKFGDIWDKSLRDLLKESANAALKDAKLSTKDIDCVYISNVFSHLNGNSNLASMVYEELGISNSVCICNGGISGALAIQEAAKTIEFGKSKTVLIIGVEKLSDLRTAGILKATSALLNEEEAFYGATLYSNFALVTQKYANEYGITAEDLALVPALSHKNAIKNEFAQFRSEIPKEKILQSSFVAEPIRTLECAPFCDGASAIVLCSEDISKKYDVKGYFIAGSTIAGSGSVAKLESLTSFDTTKKAMEASLKTCKIDKSKIELFEVYDLVPISEIIALEDLGLAKRGKGLDYLKASSKRINPSGGLKACGHAVGATGIRQVVDLIKNLGKSRNYGLAHILSATGSISSVNIVGGPNV